MSSVAPAASQVATPFTPRPAAPQAASTEATDKLAATAVAAQTNKEAHKGLKVDLTA